jgi:hypothetical protein
MFTNRTTVSDVPGSVNGQRQDVLRRASNATVVPSTQMRLGQHNGQLLVSPSRDDPIQNYVPVEQGPHAAYAPGTGPQNVQALYDQTQASMEASAAASAAEEAAVANRRVIAYYPTGGPIYEGQALPEVYFDLNRNRRYRDGE